MEGVMVVCCLKSILGVWQRGCVHEVNGDSLGVPGLRHLQNPVGHGGFIQLTGNS